MKVGEKYRVIGCSTLLTVGTDGWLYSEYGPVSKNLMQMVLSSPEIIIRVEDKQCFEKSKNTASQGTQMPQQHRCSALLHWLSVDWPIIEMVKRLHAPQK